VLRPDMDALFAIRRKEAQNLAYLSGGNNHCCRLRAAARAGAFFAALVPGGDAAAASGGKLLHTPRSQHGVPPRCRLYLPAGRLCLWRGLAFMLCSASTAQHCCAASLGLATRRATSASSAAMLCAHARRLCRCSMPSPRAGCGAVAPYKIRWLLRETLPGLDISAENQSSLPFWTAVAGCRWAPFLAW